MPFGIAATYSVLLVVAGFVCIALSYTSLVNDASRMRSLGEILVIFGCFFLVLVPSGEIMTPAG